MTQRQSFGILIANGVVAVLIIVGAVVLCGIGKIDAAALTGLLGSAIGAVGVLGNSLGSASINGGPKPDLTRLAATHPEAVSQLLSKLSHPTPTPAAAPTASVAGDPSAATVATADASSGAAGGA